MESNYFQEDFIAEVIAAGARARIETLEAGVPVFYLDRARNLDILEQPDGRTYEIRFIAGAPRGKNYEVIREVDPPTK